MKRRIAVLGACAAIMSACGPAGYYATIASRAQDLTNLDLRFYDVCVAPLDTGQCRSVITQEKSVATRMAGDFVHADHPASLQRTAQRGQQEARALVTACDSMLAALSKGDTTAFESARLDHDAASSGVESEAGEVDANRPFLDTVVNDPILYWAIRIIGPLFLLSIIAQLIVAVERGREQQSATAQAPAPGEHADAVEDDEDPARSIARSLRSIESLLRETVRLAPRKTVLAQIEQGLRLFQLVAVGTAALLGLLKIFFGVG